MQICFNKQPLKMINLPLINLSALRNLFLIINHLIILQTIWGIETSDRYKNN